VVAGDPGELRGGRWEVAGRAGGAQIQIQFFFAYKFFLMFFFSFHLINLSLSKFFS